ncbi:MAG: LapA family protein [Gammaproteobacteria bacterium]|nr:LapA family protein [Gammaproteobacteria bacterium]
MYKLITFLITLTLVAVGIILGILNPEPVPLDLFLITLTLPLSLVLAVMLTFGILLGASIIFIKVAKLKWGLRLCEKRSIRQADEIVQLKKQLSIERRAAKTPLAAPTPIENKL